MRGISFRGDIAIDSISMNDYQLPSCSSPGKPPPPKRRYIYLSFNTDEKSIEYLANVITTDTEVNNCFSMYHSS